MIAAKEAGRKRSTTCGKIERNGRNTSDTRERTDSVQHFDMKKEDSVKKENSIVEKVIHQAPRQKR
ncbi:MAG: hypothetical protein K8R57_02500 [Verrucomicrobia bacterium]|nr:hypothetical protein [Verrucomicrobiota bacterium]